MTAPNPAFELSAAALRLRCEPASLGFERTSELRDHQAPVGQARAVEAIGFGVAMKQSGYNLFVLGPTGSGRNKIVRTLIEERARQEPLPSDRCYVNNFGDPHRPKLLTLPPGQGARLRDQMEHLISELEAAIPAAFESQSYRERKEAIEREMAQRHEQELEAVSAYAAAHGVAMVRTPGGFALAPTKNGEVLPPDEQDKLTKQEQERMQVAMSEVHDRLHAALKRVPQLERERRDRERVLDREVTHATVDELVAEARRAFSDVKEIADYLAQVELDILEKAVYVLRAQGSGDSGQLLGIDGTVLRESPILRRYRVNVLVDQRQRQGAPVVTSDQPTVTNLVGRIEHISQLGVLLTDFNLVKPGALHLANGGYLILDAYRLLTQPLSWDHLKRALRSREIRIESIGESLGLLSTVSQEPEPVPLDLKVILIGEPWVYYRLSALDPEFPELFKVMADFDESMPRTEEGSRDYANLLGRFARDESLLPLTAAACARVIEESARLADDARKLSLHVQPVFDLLREASQLAQSSGHDAVQPADVERAIGAAEVRHGRLRERVQEVIRDGLVHVELAQERVGQINALSVVQLGPASFGFPTRVTACVRLGRGEVVDIAREISMGGPIHSKGVMTLSAFVGSRYLPDQPLSLRATLVFEQTYGQIEGDSASLAELLVLLSAIANVPLAQGIAVTGSVDQHGRVQAVGGLHEKIEGFFETCLGRTLTGSQGVVIPRVCAGRLMLRDDVVTAVSEQHFHVHAVDDVDQAIEIVTGLPAGQRGADGKFPEGSMNARVEARLRELAAAALAFADKKAGEAAPEESRGKTPAA